MINNGHAWLECPHTIEELQRTVEKDDGRIKASTGHDDLADAWVLALQAAKRIGWTPADNEERMRKQRHKRRMQLRKDPFGNRRTT